MSENEILAAFKEGSISAEEVLAFYRSLESTHAPQPLSEGQKGLWLLYKLAPTADVYNVPICFRSARALDVTLLRQAFEHVCASHEQLSSLLVEERGEAHLRRAVGHAPAFRHTAADGWTEARMLASLVVEAKQPFDLGAAIPARASVWSSAAGTTVLLVFHHLVFDGASVPIVLRDLFASYAALQAGSPLPQLPGAGKAAGFAAWERELLASAEGARQRDFWLRTLDGPLPVLTLDIERGGPARPARGASWRHTLGATGSDALRRFCAAQRVQPAVLFLAAYQALLHSHSGQRDLIVGVPSMGRPDPSWSDAVGYFVNMMPVRCQFDGNCGIGAHLNALGLVMADAIDHASYPFPRIVQALGTSAGSASAPVFQVAYTFQNRRMMQGSAESVAANLAADIEFIEAIGQEGEFKLLFEVYEQAEDFLLCLKYDAQRFDAADVAAMGARLQTLLAQMITDPLRTLASCSPLPAAERHQMLVEWNATARPYSRDACLHQLFEACAARHPQRTALVFDGRTLSYAELNERANVLAHALRGHGVGPDVVVGVYMERSLEMVLAMLAILKAGGAWLPLEPDYPEERLDYMVKHAAAPLVLVQAGAPAGRGSAWPQPVRLLEVDAGAPPAPGMGANLPPGAAPHHLAYVIYTSGSTGRPKGVMVEHRALVNRIEWMQNEYGLDSDDVVLQKTPFSFDVSVWEFFWPLLTGARLVIARPRGHQDAHYLCTLIQEAAVTTLHFVPSMLRLAVEQPEWADCRSIRRIFCSGEALPADLPARHYARLGAPLHNLYGPTEAAIDVSYWPCPAGHAGGVVPIGKPIQNIRLYVLNESMQLQPRGVIGQLYIAGDGLARGYLNDPGLTRERFLPDPFDPAPGARMYQTGDLARWLPDGNLEYMGRMDHQVKLRGFRIELGEIEAALGRHEAVGACAVLAREDQPERRQLVAYVVCRGQQDEAALPAALKAHLARTLPEHMIPAAFVLLAALPLSANGKLDRKALPAPGIEAHARAERLAPRNATEQALRAAWAEVLDFPAEQISVHDNFFALGGHSLLVPRLVARLQEAGLQCAIRSAFDAESLAALAAQIDAEALAPAWQVPANAIAPGCARITPAMLPLVTLSEAEIDLVVRSVDGGAPNVQDIYPLAALQEGMLFHHLRESGNDPYVLSGLFSFATRQQLEHFAAALQAVIARHDALRSAVVSTGLAQPVQVVWRQALLRLEEVEVEAGADAEATMRALLALPQAMALDRAPLLRLKFAQERAGGRCFMIFNMHHIIDDATSLGLLFDEIVAHLSGRQATLPEPPRYRDFIAGSAQQLRGSAARDYFRATLGDVDEPTIAFNMRDVHGDGRRVLDLRRDLDPALGHRLRAAARQLQVSPASLFHVGWAMVLAACVGRADVVFGSVLSGRLQGTPGIERMLGNFINTLPVRVNLESQSVQAAVAATDRALRTLLRYEQAPLSLAQDCSGVANDVPLFNTIFNFRHLEDSGRVGAADLARHGIVSLVGVLERSNYPVAVSVDDLGTGFSIDAQVEQSQDAGMLISYLETAMAAIAAALDARDEGPALAMPVLPAALREQVLHDWNQTGDYGRSACLHELFEQQAAARPDSIALAHAGATLSYGALNARANQLAHHLRALGVGPDVRVALCAPRGIGLLVGLLAILKAGGAYVPLEPEYPPERLCYLLQDSAPLLLLAQGALAPEVQAVAPARLDLDTDAARWAGQSEANPAPLARPEHLAYVIYTSGSSGTPKGVMVEHRNVTRLFGATEADFQFGAADVWTLFHSFAFDFSVWEIWGALLHGGRLVIVPSAVCRNPADFYALLCSAGVTVLNQTPGAFRQLMAVQAGDARAHRLRAVIFGGEALEVASLRPWMEDPRNHATRMINMYGITETTVHVTYRPLTLADTARVGASPIGRRLSDLRLYLLDARGQPAPVGAVAELYVGGAGVARGYLNRPELNVARFLPDPFAREPGARMYRSGDLARYLPDGEIEYLGRNDQQVKIRGFRMELGEIEARLGAHPAVEDVRVVARAYGEQDTRLVAYVVPAPAQAYPLRQLLQIRRESPELLAQSYELPNGMTVFHQNKSETDFVFDEIFTKLDYLRHGVTLRDGDCVFDVGANIGMFSLFVASRCRNATIHAFEPIPPVCATLALNARLYGLDATVHQCGLAAAPGRETFTFYRHNTVISSSRTTAEQAHQVVRSFLLNQQELAGADEAISDAALGELVDARLDSEQFSCELRTLSDVIAAHGVARIDLLKIDVENAEYEVLKGIGAHDWSRIAQLVIEVHDVDGRLERIVDLLARQGYTVNYEQDNNLLHNTRLYNVYAVRGPGRPAPQEAAVPFQWSSQSALLADLQASLRRHLPEYMAPAAYVLMEQLPLTHNGKLDLGSLPAPDTTLAAAVQGAPASALECTLAAIWSELLEIDPARLTVASNFFDCGGNSLLVTRLVNRIVQCTGISLPIPSAFESPTLGAMAHALEQRQEAPPQVFVDHFDKILEGIALIEGMSDAELAALKS